MQYLGKGALDDSDQRGQEHDLILHLQLLYLILLTAVPGRFMSNISSGIIYPLDQIDFVRVDTGVTD